MSNRTNTLDKLSDLELFRVVCTGLATLEDAIHRTVYVGDPAAGLHRIMPRKGADVQGDMTKAKRAAAELMIRMGGSTAALHSLGLHVHNVGGAMPPGGYVSATPNNMSWDAVTSSDFADDGCAACGVSKIQMQIRDIMSASRLWVQRSDNEAMVLRIEDEDDSGSVVIESLCYSCWRNKYGPGSLSALGIGGWRDEMIDPPYFLDADEEAAWAKRKKEYDDIQEARYVERTIRTDMFEP
ncbi:MAG: hypothetical protein WCI73_08610 [Phycisphaerae bacterium]